MAEIVTLSVNDIVFDKKLYTRTESQSPAKVQEYALSIADGVFPHIIVNQDKVILDGWHRWMAHKEAELHTIDVEILDTSSMDEFEIRRKAARWNFRHGIPQTEKELKKLIRDEYRAKLDDLDHAGRAELKRTMADDYSRSERYIRECTARIDKDLKVELRETAFDLWLSCHTHEEIADQVGYGKQAISDFLSPIQSYQFVNINRLSENGTSAKIGPSAENAALVNLSQLEDEEEDGASNSLGTYTFDRRAAITAEHMDEDYKPPIYNVWKQQEKSNGGASHFGNSEVTWVDHLLYLYTKPFDIVVDPFAGSGSTIDICKRRYRRHLVSDRIPNDKRSDIRLHDVTEGVLSPPSWKDTRLVYLDPPYWIQAQGQYSKDGSDLGNMELAQFTDTLASVIKQYAEKIKRARAERPTFIAMIMQPTQWRAPEKRYTDHVADMLREVNLPIDMRIQAPYESQQYNAQMVDWAKENRKVLVLSREIVVWRVGGAA